MSLPHCMLAVEGGIDLLSSIWKCVLADFTGGGCEETLAALLITERCVFTDI